MHHSNSTHICLASTPSHLWDEEVNAKGSILVRQVLFYLLYLATCTISDIERAVGMSCLSSEHFGSVSYTSDYTQTTVVRHSGCKFWAGCDVHSSQ
jgi:hypothetical protein